MNQNGIASNPSKSSKMTPKSKYPKIAKKNNVDVIEQTTKHGTARSGIALHRVTKRLKPNNDKQLTKYKLSYPPMIIFSNVK
jgi:hypothetical protein